MSESPITILVVEDDPGDQLLVRRMLSESTLSPEYVVTTAGSLRSGLDRLGQNGIDLVLLDLTLPDSQGLATFDAVSDHSPGVPVVILSGFDNSLLATEAVRKGAQDYLVKGRIDGEFLTQSIRYAIGRKVIENFREELSAIVAHELRTPLSIVREGLSQIFDGLLGPTTERQRVCLEMCLRRIDGLNRLTHDLLDVASLEAGKIDLFRESVDLADLARETCESFRARAATKGVSILEDIPAGPVEVLGDRDRLAQILVNLVGNAVKFTSRGHVRTSLTARGTSVECVVADTGCGIAPDDLPKVFTKFQRFSRPLDASEKGNGLGLAICKGLVELHGGKIHVASEPGRGTRLTVELPARMPPESHDGNAVPLTAG